MAYKDEAGTPEGSLLCEKDLCWLTYADDALSLEPGLGEVSTVATVLLTNHNMARILTPELALIPGPSECHGCLYLSVKWYDSFHYTTGLDVVGAASCAGLGANVRKFGDEAAVYRSSAEPELLSGYNDMTTDFE